MRRALEAALLAVLLVALAAPLPTAPAAANACGDAAATLRAAQDDAGSGGDAPDDGDAPLRLDEAGNYTGRLDLVGAVDADLDDWYVVQLAGEGERMEFALSPDYGAHESVYVTMLRMAVFAPGEDAPRAVRGASAPFVFENHEPGLWRVRVLAEPLSRSAACDGAAGSAALDAPSVGAAREATSDYGLYVGCHPICVVHSSASA